MLAGPVDCRRLHADFSFDRLCCVTEKFQHARFDQDCAPSDKRDDEHPLYDQHIPFDDFLGKVFGKVSPQIIRYKENEITDEVIFECFDKHPDAQSLCHREDERDDQHCDKDPLEPPEYFIMFENIEFFVFEDIEDKYAKEAYCEDFFPEPQHFHEWSCDVQDVGDKIVDDKV